MTHKIILTDVDEVVLNWDTAFEEWYIKTCESFGGTKPTTKLRDSENIEKWLNCSIDTTRKLIEQFNQCKDHFPYLLPYDHAVKWVNRLHREGWGFVAITACTNDTWTHDARRENLERHFPGVFDTIHLVGLGQPKTKFLERYKATWWVDDKPKHAEEGGRIGHKAFLMEQHYNKDFPCRLSKRVTSWEEIYNCINDSDCYRYGWMA
jgi:FMN phosphatase YigB (HAD superfamily)